MLQIGDSSIKRVKVEQEIDNRDACDVDTIEPCLIAPEPPMESDSMGVVENTSDVPELSKEMKEMKIREDETDDHETNVKVCFRFNPLSNFDVTLVDEEDKVNSSVNFFNLL